VAVWQRGGAPINVKRYQEDPEFWISLPGLSRRKYPAPEYKSKELLSSRISALRVPRRISLHSYRVLSKAFAIRITALDIGLDRLRQPVNSGQNSKLQLCGRHFQGRGQFANELHDAIFNAYDQLFMRISQKRPKNFFRTWLLKTMNPRSWQASASWG